jgi:hypothetical protein
MTGSEEVREPVGVLRASELEVVVQADGRLRFGDGVTAVLIDVDDPRRLAKAMAQITQRCVDVERCRNAAAGADEGLRHQRLGQGLIAVPRPRDEDDDWLAQQC